MRVKEKDRIGRRAVILTMHPAPLLRKDGAGEVLLAAPTLIGNVRELDGLLKALGHAAGARGYLAEFAGARPVDRAPMWRPILRLGLTETDLDEAPGAPDRDEVASWLGRPLDQVAVEEFRDRAVPAPGGR